MIVTALNIVCLIDSSSLFLPYFSSFNLKYLVVFYSVVAQALSLSKAVRDLLRIAICIDACVEGKVPVYLWEGLGTVHMGLPLRATMLRTVTALVVHRAYIKKKINTWWHKLILLFFFKQKHIWWALWMMFYLWEWMGTLQHACSWAGRGCERLCRWRTFCSEPDRSHPDDPGPGSKSWSSAQ